MEVVALRSCLGICGSLGVQLLHAKHNKDECRSLSTVVACIESFLRKIPTAAVSARGLTTLDALQDVLSRAEAFLKRISNTGPLVSLLSASIIRQDFLRINRDLTSTFQILAAGEQLLEMADARADVMRELSQAKLFFAEKEQLAHRLQEIAAAAQQQHSTDEVLHATLLKQLESIKEITQLSPDELLTELHALQLAAMYGDTHAQEDCSRKKSLGSQTEEFLVQQVCAALTPKAYQASAPLTPTDTLNIPEAYLCPISKDIMTNPVILGETGQTYEAANIQRWLESHNTCPATNKLLRSKMLTSNYVLKALVHSWAQQHGVALPTAPKYAPLFAKKDAAQSFQAADIEAPVPGNIQRLQLQPPRTPNFDARPHRRRSNCLRCSRTKWFIGLVIAAVVIALVVGLGVFFYNRSKNRGGSRTFCLGVPAALANATWAAAAGGTCAGSSVGSKCIASCASGLNTSAETLTATCKEDGTWSPADGVCSAKDVVPSGSNQTKPVAELSTLPGMPPPLTWTYGTFEYQLYKPARNWRQAENLCMQLGDGFHLASINTEEEFNTVSNHLVYTNSSMYSHGDAFLVGCGAEGKDVVPTVWVGLHDPKNLNQSMATWTTVVQTFVWSDGRSSPFLLSNANGFFAGGGVEKQEEHCIGFSFCSNQNTQASGLDAVSTNFNAPIAAPQSYGAHRVLHTI